MNWKLTLFGVIDSFLTISWWILSNIFRDAQRTIDVAKVWTQYCNDLHWLQHSLNNSILWFLKVFVYQSLKKSHFHPNKSYLSSKSLFRVNLKISSGIFWFKRWLPQFKTWKYAKIDLLFSNSLKAHSPLPLKSKI